MSLPAAHKSIVDLFTVLDRLGINIPVAHTNTIRQDFYRFRVESKVVYAIKESSGFKVVRYTKN